MPTALRNAGYVCEIHDENFGQGTEDTAWLTAARERRMGRVDEGRTYPLPAIGAMGSPHDWSARLHHDLRQPEGKRHSPRARKGDEENTGGFEGLNGSFYLLRVQGLVDQTSVLVDFTSSQFHLQAFAGFRSGGYGDEAAKRLIDGL